MHGLKERVVFLRYPATRLDLPMTRLETFLIHPPIGEHIGGPHTFATHLKAYLEDNGFREHGKVEDGLGALIVFVQAPLSLLWKARRLRVPVILRLDGLYYPSKHGLLSREYLRVNLKVFIIRRFLCDLVIYQSAFCEAMANRLLGRTSKPGRVIVNGTPDLPPPGPSRPEGSPLRLVATGRFRGPDMLPATVAALDLCKGRTDFTLDVFGHLDEASRPFLSRPYITYHGPRPNAEVRAALGGYDALIFTQLGAPCPNTVLEAVAAGIPVLAYDSGAVRELLPFNRELVAETPKRLLHRFGDFDPRKLADKVILLGERRESFRRESLRHINRFSFPATLHKYVEALEEFVEARRR
jgi:glycosyltransferase involved in cell wall biosynthesis